MADANGIAGIGEGHRNSVVERHGEVRKALQMPVVNHPVVVGQQVPNAVEDPQAVPVGAERCRQVDAEMLPEQLGGVIKTLEDVAPSGGQWLSVGYLVVEPGLQMRLQGGHDGAQCRGCRLLNRAEFPELVESVSRELTQRVQNGALCGERIPGDDLRRQWPAYRAGDVLAENGVTVRTRLALSLPDGGRR